MLPSIPGGTIGGGVLRGLSATRVLGAVGLASLAIGAVRIIATSNGAGVVALVVAAAILVISPFIIRPDRTAISEPSELELGLTREISQLGAPKAAQIRQHTGLATFAESYAFIHKELVDARY
jgi:hypothetical protein